MRPEAAALVVHDLKNALIALEGDLDALRQAPDREGAGRAHARCATMRRRFMAFLTLYGGGGELRAHCADESPLGLLHNIAGSVSNVAISVGVAPGVGTPPFWHVDVRLVRMALDAALHNAVRFARHGVVLGVREDAGHLVFIIDDDGPGLGSTDACATSTGLGTALCRAVARAHATPDRAGGVKLFDREGGGARFELWLA